MQLFQKTAHSSILVCIEFLRTFAQKCAIIQKEIRGRTVGYVPVDGKEEEGRIFLCFRLFAFLYGKFAAIESAFGANGVIDVRCAAVRADDDLRRFSHVVRTTSGSSAI